MERRIWLASYRLCDHYSEKQILKSLIELFIEKMAAQDFFNFLAKFGSLRVVWKLNAYALHAIPL